jgi:hypothetical protein
MRLEGTRHVLCLPATACAHANANQGIDEVCHKPDARTGTVSAHRSHTAIEEILDTIALPLRQPAGIDRDQSRRLTIR